MALTKLPKNALGTGSIDDSKIEDGTVAAVEITGTLPADKLASTLDLSSKTVTLPDTSVTSGMLAGSISNAKLSNSTITFNGTSKALGTSFDLVADVNWQSVVTGDTTMVASRGYFVDTSSSAINMTLPSSASIGDTIKIKDYKATFGTNNMTIVRNGHKIQGATLNSTITTSRASLTLVYVDATKGWIYTQEYNVGNKGIAQFTEATGGTVTTSGDFKIHTFTGDGCFAVSQTGVPIGDNGGPASVDYLVVAGGGGGGKRGGGGGAGGHRTSFPSPSCNAGAFPITAQTYPITVGAGGAGSNCVSAIDKGSSSVFSTITSAGGGGGLSGATVDCGPSPNAKGGSGGGGGAPTGSTDAKPGGSGNEPPVSPPQGNDGGAGRQRSSGGGGGSGATGGSGTNNGNAGGGGNGTANSITGSSVTRAGGGGGAVAPNGPSGTAGSGGTGGAGNGVKATGNCSGFDGGAATANTGSGGGGSSAGPNGVAGTGGAGGKGIVIIRYKYQ